MTAVQGRAVMIPTDDGVADAYYVRPDDDAPHPGILFYHDLMGIRPVMTNMADRLSSAGYTVLVPNTFYRHGPAPTVAGMPDIVPEDRVMELAEKAMAVANARTAEGSVRDALVWLDWLAADPLTNDGPVGVTGYGHGCMLCVRTAGVYPDRVAAVAIIHGSYLITDEPDSPHLVADRIKGEVYLANGEKDVLNPPGLAERFNEILSAAGVRYRAETFPGAQHGFTAPDFPSMYDKAADDAHWAGMLDLFARTF